MRGFTLIETVIGIVVLGVITLGLFATFTGVFTSAVRDEVVTVATSLARGELERVERVARSSSLNFDSLASSSSPVSFGGNFTNYSWQIIVVNGAPFYVTVPAQYKQVESRVTNPMVGTISLKTIFTKR